MIGSQQKRLEIADGNIHPRQPFARLVGRRRPSGMVLGLATLHQKGQRIAAHQLTGRKMTVNKQRHRFPVDGRDLLHGDKPGTLVPVLNRHHHRGFAFGAAASLSPAATTTDPGMVDLDQIVQPLVGVPSSHGNADLAQHPAGCHLGNHDLFGKTNGRNAALARGSQVDRPEPLDQGQIGDVKQGSAVSEAS